MIIPESLDEDEACRRTGLALSTFQRWRREDYGPPYNKVKNVVLYILEGFDAAVTRARNGEGKPSPPVGRKVDPRKRAAGLHMQRKGPDAAIVKRLMKSIRKNPVRVERHGAQEHFILADAGGECFRAIFEGDTLIDMVDLR